MQRSLRRELQLGVRSLARSPGLAALAVLAIGLGTALTSGIFGLTDAIAFQAPPYAKIDRLVDIGRADAGQPDQYLRITDTHFSRWRREARSFDGLFGYYTGTVNIAAPGLPPERLQGAFSTPTFLEVLGLSVALGRGFTEADGEPGAKPVVLISDEVWKTRFRGDSRILGRTLRVNGEDREIVGVMPPGIQPPQREHIWVALGNDGAVGPWHRQTDVSLMVIGRLAPGVTHAAAVAELESLETPASGATIKLMPLGLSAAKRINRDYLTLIAMALFVFTISVANAANLQLARYCERARDLAIRAAIGATRLQLVRELLLESLLIGLLGGIIGLVLGTWFLELIRLGAERMNVPYWIRVGLDPRTFTFTLAVSLGAGLLAGLLPTWRVTALELGPVLKDGGRNLTSLRQGRFSRGLAMLQLSLTATVLVLAGLTIRSFARLDKADLGYRPEQVFSARMALFLPDYPTVEDRRNLLDRLASALEQRPGIRAASATSWLIDGNVKPSVEVSAASPEGSPVVKAVSEHLAPGFFRSLGRELVSGRDFTREDIATEAPVALVNQRLARELFGTDDPVGRTLRFRSRFGKEDTGELELEIIGVTPDVSFAFKHHDQGIAPAVYRHLGPADLTFATVTLYSQLDPEATLRLLRAEVQQLDPDLPLYFARTIRKAVTDATWDLRLWSATIQLFGVSAMLLSGVGLHGLMANAVRQRRQEISVRLALGASRREVIRHVLGRAVWQLALGLGIGLTAAGFIAIRLGGLLGATDPLDPAVYAGTVAFLVTLSLLACALPLRRALQANPFQALRWE